MTEPVHIVPLNLLLPDTRVDVLPLAADPLLFTPKQLQPEELERYGCEVLFVGSGYGGSPAGRVRASVLASLVTRYKVKIFGDGWLPPCNGFPTLAAYFHGPITSSEELNTAYNAAKIVVVVHHTQCKHQTNQAPYEASCAGAFVVA